MTRGITLRLIAYAALLNVNSICAAQAVFPPAYRLAAQQVGIPPDVLFAVALQESGITLRGQRVPWPWTLNVAGRGHYFANQADACQTLQLVLSRTPAYRVDVGLAQINLGHQRKFYRHPCELLRPQRNLNVAATILRTHHQAGEDWLTTTGRYHRPAGGPPAAWYRRSISKHLNQLASARSAQP